MRRQAGDTAATVPERRPLLCLPGEAARSLPYRLSGYLCRILVIAAATGGLAVFVSGAMMLEIPNGYLMGVSLLFVCLISLFCLSGKTAVLGVVCTVGLAVWQAVTNAGLVRDLPYAPLALYNGCIRRLESAGYLSFSSMGAHFSAASSQEALLRAGMAMLILLFALLFTISLLRRANLIPPAILSTTVLAVILTFNVYSNRIQSNLGIVLVIASFAAVLVMAACDRTYRQTPHRQDQSDNQLPNEADAQRPPMPDNYMQKTQRRNRRARQRIRHTRTVDEELSDYMSAGKTNPRSSAKDSGDRQKDRSLRTQIRAVRTFDRITDRARGAAGGFAALATLLVCLLAVALPACLIRGNFTTIDPIDEKLSFARDYVTAVLRGDDSRLDELSYQADSSHFTSRSAKLEHLSFTGRQILYVKARYQTGYYLTGWIGTDYEDGAWQAVDTETRLTYRRLFGTDTSPSESLRYHFYHYTKPSLVDGDNTPEDLLTSYGGSRDYGFLTVLVHMRRINSPGSEALLPSVYASRFGLSDYDSATASKLGIVNYYDGIRTGRDFAENGVSYAAVADVPLMSNERWASNVAELSEAWTLGREAVLIWTHIPHMNTVAAADSPLNLTVSEENGATVFAYAYNVKKGEAETTFRFYHPSGHVTRTPSGYTVTEETGTLTLLVSSGKVVGVSLTGCDTDELPNLLEQYRNHMTDEERRALTDVLEDERSYSDFVYSTYTRTSGSEYIRALAATIRADAHLWKAAESVEGLYAEPVDVTLASRRDTASGQAFIQRDALVRSVIDYIIRDMGCTYSLTPDLSKTDPSLDGVENFLRNTQEGYCVQFASAAALLLREYGIPVRFAEGYLAQGLSRAGNSDFVYGGYVHDYEAHAWIEVYFDGIGWILYETTPTYYTGLYGFYGAVSDTTNPVSPLPSDTETTPSQPETEPGETESIPLVETDSNPGIGSETENAPGDPAARKTAGIVMGILIGIGVLITWLATVVRRAHEAQFRRHELAERVLALERDPEAPREMAHALCDNVTELLGLYGLSPAAGEFPDAYAERLATALSSQPKTGRPAPDSGPLPPIRPVLDALAAEEFGHGMTTAELQQMASLYLFLHSQRARFLSPHTRLWLRYVKRRI